MKKILTALLIIAALATATYYFVSNENFTTFEDTETSFGFKNTNNISKIIITEPNGWKIKLEKQDGNFWMVNDYYLAREDAIELLFETFKKIKVDKPMPLAAQQKMNDELNQKGRLVEIYENNANEPSKAYRLYGSSVNRTGTFMKMEGFETPYLVHIPGFIGSFDIRFHTLLEKWRSHKIFAGTPNDIKQLNVIYNETPNESYSIVNNGNAYTISPLKTEPQPLNEQIAQVKAKNIIQSIPNLNIEAFDNLYLYKDSLLNMQPFGKIEIIGNNNQSQTLTVYNMPLTEKSKIGSDERSQKFDQDRFYATMNKGEDLVIIQKYAFENVLSKYSDFVGEKVE